MDPDFWRARWRDGQIGFHEGRPYELLARHHGHLGAGSTVFVPLCGKAVDMELLAAEGHRVVGVDLVESALRAFFAERTVTPEESTGDGTLRLGWGSIALRAADVFVLRAAHLEGAGAFYDRAAVVALPPALRARYVAHLRELLPAGSRGLVVTLEYDQARVDGPPFSVTEAELRSLYAGATVTHLETREAAAPKFTAAGVPLREHAFAVTL